MDERTIFEAIRRNVLVVVPEIPEDAIVPGCTLSELGLNSIDRVEVVTLTMEELAISVPVHELRREATIEALVGVIRRHA